MVNLFREISGVYYFWNEAVHNSFKTQAQKNNALYNFMTSLSDVKQAKIIEAFKSTSRYLDDLLNIDYPYFEGMVNRIYPPELQLNKANTSDTEAQFLDSHLSISNGFVSSKIYNKRDDFDFDIVNFPFLDGDVPHSTSYGVYISQIRLLVMWLISMPVIKL